jgi:hypothetical protein
VGNVDHRYVTGTNYHARAEVVVAWGGGHGATDRGRVFSYQIDGDPANPAHYVVSEVSTVFDTGDRMAIGEVWSNPSADPFDDIIIAHSDGEIWAYILTGSLLHFSSDYRAGDLFAVGDLLGDTSVEMVVGDVSADQLKIYAGSIPAGETRPVYARESTINGTLDSEDGLAIGDVLGDGYAEIVVADASEGRFTIYGYNAGLDRFEAVADFALDYFADDEIACGYFSGRDKEQVLVFRGHGLETRRAGTLEIVSYFAGERPGDRWALDGLMNVDGAWTTRLSTNWASEGHLLIVGENEIVPTFSKHWDIDGWEGGGRVDYTDRNYASTGVDDDVNTPELALGRLVGNTPERLNVALRTAIELAGEPGHLRNGRALCLSGPDPDDDGKFVDLRDSIAERLGTRGFSVTERHLPDDVTFFANDDDRDVIFLAGHGNTTVWGSCLTQSNVFNHFDPGFARPLVFAASCLTGRYPAGGSTLGEQFLWTGASGYLGATEVTYSWGTHGRGWSPRFAEAFFSRLESGRSVGLSLKLTKRHRLSDGANTYASDWNKNRYHCAVYHLYGDPKAQFEWTAAAPSLAGLAPRAAASGDPVMGPLTEYRLTVPAYVVVPGKTSDDVTIPDGEVLGEPGRAAVPFYTATIRFPRGQVPQTVSLKQRSNPTVRKDLRLPPVAPFTNAPGAVAKAMVPSPGWWPDRDFDWSMKENPDGSRDVTLKAFAFLHNADTGETRFHSNYVFGLQWAASTVDITRLATDCRVYAAGATMHAGLTVTQTGQQPIDVTAEGSILANETEVVARLAPIPMPRLATLGWTQFEWPTAGQADGDYVLEVFVRDAAGNELDRARTEFQVGRAGEPPRWESISVTDGKVHLRWPSQVGRTYGVEFTAELGAVPFKAIATGLPATPPRNSFVDEARRPAGFYRLTESGP